jgi:hypothetical protein
MVQHLPDARWFFLTLLVLFLRLDRKEDMDDTTAADSMHT